MFIKNIFVYFYSLKTEFESIKKDQRYTNSFQLFKFQIFLIAKCQLLLILLIIVIGYDGLLENMGGMFTKMAISQLLIGLFSKFFH